MHFNTFRESIKKLIAQQSSEWIIFGDAHISDEQISYSDIDFLINAVNYYKPKSLGLANMHIGDEQMMYLAPLLYDNANVETLYFSFNLIGDKGAEALADLLIKNPYIKELMLLRNKIGDKGMTALAGMLHHNTTLVKMELFDNPFSKLSSAGFIEAIKCNQTIKTLLLYPANDGIVLTDNHDQLQQEILRKRKHRMMLLNVNKRPTEEISVYRKLHIRGW